MMVLASPIDPAVIEKILRHLELPSTPPPSSPPRHGPWQPHLDFLPPVHADGDRREGGESRSWGGHRTGTLRSLLAHPTPAV